MHSDQPYHAERLLNLANNPRYNKYFLAKMYQASSVSTRSRNGTTWELWLHNVAGVRWYPTLSDPDNQNKLHWMIEVLRDKNSAAFVPLIQHYWVQEYSDTCRLNNTIKQALKECKVLCQHNGFEELQKTWFPTRQIVEIVKYFGVEEKFPILALPDSTNDHMISQWPSLTELGVRSSLDLSFYKQVLSLLADAGEAPAIGAVMMGLLYKSVGDRVTLEDLEDLKDEFKRKALIWDPESSKWRTIQECVWKSTITLMCKFVLTSKYDESAIAGLFHVHLEASDITIHSLIDELQFMKNSSSSEVDGTLIDRASAIYALLKDLTKTTEDKVSLRDINKNLALIYNTKSRTWLKPSSCVWHTTVEFENHVPIAAMYPELKGFFVDILGVSTVTDVFMMKQLATAAAKPSKNADEIKRLMLSASELLHVNSQSSNFEKSIEILQKKKASFFIIDSEYYAEKFRGKLILLDFTYEQLISLNKLFQILGLDARYLTKHVHPETSANTATTDSSLTQQFRQCAYAISCCAISHQSPLFSNQNKQMYNDLRTAIVNTSADMSTELVVEENDNKVKVECGRPSLMMKRDKAGLLITLPLARKERIQTMRGQLPGDLSDLLQINDSRGEKQIYRIMNELESSTDEILLDEEISRVSWLSDTSRPVHAFEPEVETQLHRQAPSRPSLNFVNGETADLPRHAQLYLENQDSEFAIPTARSISFNYSGVIDPPPTLFRPLPETLNHAVDAPDYWKVLEHVRKQATSAGSDSQHSSASIDDFIQHFAFLALDNTKLDPAGYPRLFGADFWLSKFRIGAAGELFVYELLRCLTSNDLDLQHWQSEIRHFVQANTQYSYVTKWTGQEVADIMYKDQDNLLGKTLRSKIIGDAFQDWWPDWLGDVVQDQNQESLEWLFEIKTSIGPCETDFVMSQTQYDLMRSFSEAGPTQTQTQNQQNGTTTTHSQQRQSNRVYCIIRVYNLLSEKIGVRFFIDPWRLRERRLEFGTTEKWKVKAVNI